MLRTPIVRVACALVLALAFVSCSPKPKIDKAEHDVLSAREELERIRIESMLCLDVFDAEALVKMTGTAKPCEVEIERGDAGFGTVRSIGQLHSANYETSNAEDDVLTQYQLAILRLLLADSARTVFVEGLEAGMTTPMDARIRERLQEAFTPVPDPDQFPKLEGPQFEILRRSLAPFVFQALEPRAAVIGADDTVALYQLAHPRDLDALVLDSLTYERRELVAMATVCRHLTAHRGDVVFLVYGAAHIFQRSRVPEGLPCPRIVMTTFPGLAAASPGFQAQVLQRLKDPRLIAQYLERLGNLNPDCFELLPEAEQFHALKKTFLLTLKVSDPDSLKRYLKRTAKSDSVRAAIEKDGLWYKSRQTKRRA